MKRIGVIMTLAAVTAAAGLRQIGALRKEIARKA